MSTAVLKAFAWSALEQVGRQGIRFVLSIFLARMLAPAEYGLMGMLLVFLLVAQVFVDSGLSAGLIQRREVSADEETSVFYLNIVAGMALATVLCAVSPVVARFYGQTILQPLLCVSAVGVVAGSFGVVQLALMTRRVDFRTQTNVTLLSGVGSGVLGLAMAWRGWGVWSLAGQSVSQSVLGAAFVWWQSPWRPTGRFRWACIRALWPFSSRLLASGLLNTMFQNLYALVIGKLYQPAELGYYTRASTFAMLPANSATAATQRVMFPVFSQLQHEPHRLCQEFRKIARALVLLYFPLMAGMSCVAGPLVRCLLTDKWLPCVPYFRVLCVCGMLYPLHALHLNVLAAQGRSDLFFRLEVVKKVLVIAVLGSTFRIGVGAMVWGMLGSSVIGLAINGYYTRRLIGYSWWRQAGDLCPGIALCAAMAGLVCSVAWAVSWQRWGLLSLQTIAGAVFYGVAVLVMRWWMYGDVVDVLLRLWRRSTSPPAMAAVGGEA